jgi:hypothetical protein
MNAVGFGMLIPAWDPCDRILCGSSGLTGASQGHFVSGCCAWLPTTGWARLCNCSYWMTWSRIFSCLSGSTLNDRNHCDYYAEFESHSVLVVIGVGTGVCLVVFWVPCEVRSRPVRVAICVGIPVLFDGVSGFFARLRLTPCSDCD